MVRPVREAPPSSVCWSRRPVETSTSSGGPRIVRSARSRAPRWATWRRRSRSLAGWAGPRSPRQLAGLLAGLLLVGCAPALPTWTGGSTTPRDRGDVAFGTAVRLPTGALRDLGPAPSDYRERAEPAGFAPVALARYGVKRGLDVGLMLAGTTLRLEVRGEVSPREGSTRPTWIVGAAPFVGWLPGRDVEGGREGGGLRAGLDLPAARAIEIGGLYEVWLGLRGGMELVRGDFAQAGAPTARASAFAVRAGPMLGMAIGFRRFHAFVELTAAYEHWWGSHGETSLRRGGVVLLPSFGLRVRL